MGSGSNGWRAFGQARSTSETHWGWTYGDGSTSADYGSPHIRRHSYVLAALAGEDERDYQEGLDAERDYAPTRVRVPSRLGFESDDPLLPEAIQFSRPK